MVLAGLGEKDKKGGVRELSDGNIFNLLLTLPLFQGMSRSDLQEAVAHTKLGFETHDGGERLVQCGDHCTHQLYLVAGQMVVTTSATDKAYYLQEVVSGPLLLQPERLFGLNQTYTRTFTTHTSCQILSISKTELVRLAAKFDIFRINLLNTLTTQAQRAADEPWQPPVEGIGDKMIHFIRSRCLTPTGEKQLHITMQALATNIGESRLNVSRQLHRWEEQGLITLSRNLITWNIER